MSSSILKEIIDISVDTAKRIKEVELENKQLKQQLKEAVEVIEEIKDICDKKFLLNINDDQFTSLRRYNGRVNEFLAKYRGEK